MAIKVVYSRTTDKYVSLSKRASDANKAGADVFVSIHLNAARSSVRGFEIFHYPGSSAGRRLATSVHDAVLRNKSLVARDRGIKTANFAVLRLTNMPSALVELGFITNALDARLLKSKQDEFAKQIAEGIRKIVGPNGTVFLDAGHGGKDPGATGNGAKEKDIALAVTLEIGRQLQGGSSKPSKPSKNIFYRVRKSWGDVKSQIGAYENLDNAKVKVKKNKGYKVYNDNGKQVYPKPKSSKPKLTVDGYWGPATTRELQRALGTTVDGVISGQYPNSTTRAIPSANFRRRYGSNAIRALQRKIGVKADGYIGPNTVRALQKYLGTYQDGVISRPSNMVKELQRQLNNNSF